MCNIFWFLIEAVWYMPRFYVLMLRRLWRNRHKHSEQYWWNVGAGEHLAQGEKEISELKVAIIAEMIGTTKKGHNRQDEASDVAVFMLFVAFSYLVNIKDIKLNDSTNH